MDRVGHSEGSVGGPPLTMSDMFEAPPNPNKFWGLAGHISRSVGTGGDALKGQHLSHLIMSFEF